jgi:hypothetical protein
LREEAGSKGQNRIKPEYLSPGIEVEQEKAENQAGQDRKKQKYRSDKFLSPVQLYVTGRNNFIRNLGRACHRVKMLHPLDKLSFRGFINNKKFIKFLGLTTRRHNLTKPDVVNFIISGCHHVIFLIHPQLIVQ